jgi:hypothetical protein
VAKRGTELMARSSGGAPMIGERNSRDEVAPWENMQLESERTRATAAATSNADTAVAVRHKRASRILSGSLFSRGS